MDELLSMTTHNQTNRENKPVCQKVILINVTLNLQSYLNLRIGFASPNK